MPQSPIPTQLVHLLLLSLIPLASDDTPCQSIAGVIPLLVTLSLVGSLVIVLNLALWFFFIRGNELDRYLFFLQIKK